MHRSDEKTTGMEIRPVSKATRCFIIDTRNWLKPLIVYIHKAGTTQVRYWHFFLLIGVTGGTDVSSYQELITFLTWPQQCAKATQTQIF